MRSLELFSIYALCLLIASCGTARKGLELQSEPSGAQVYSKRGEKLGVTPLRFNDEQLSKSVNDELLTLLVSAPGYTDREVALQVHGNERYLLKLAKLDSSYFAQRFLYEFQPQANELVREIMGIQALIYGRKLPEAERSLDNFQKAYPNIAASYVLRASIESQRGNAPGPVPCAHRLFRTDCRSCLYSGF